MASLPGTVISAQITTGDTANDFSIGDTNLMQGGQHTVDSVADRDLITAARRHEGMTCWVRDERVMYQLVGGITNSDWIPAATSLAQGDGAYSGTTLTPDLTGPAYQSYTINGNVDITLTNAAVTSPEVRSVTTRFIASGSGTYALTFTGTHTWLGNGVPTEIIGAKQMLINFTSFGTADADVYAAYTST